MAPNNTIDNGRVQYITTIDEWNTALLQYETCIIDCSAQWCGPCRAVYPVFVDLSRQYEEIGFLKIDVDDTDTDIIKLLEVVSMPTFRAVHKQQVIMDDDFRLCGANGNALKEFVSKIAHRFTQ
jgi:thioredoxin 1